MLWERLLQLASCPKLPVRDVGPRSVNRRVDRVPYIYAARLQFVAAKIPQTRVAFLPYGPKSLKTLKPVSYEREPQTLGQHLKKRRVELGLRQRDVEARFNLDDETYANWEKGRC